MHHIPVTAECWKHFRGANTKRLLMSSTSLLPPGAAKLLEDSNDAAWVTAGVCLQPGGKGEENLVGRETQAVQRKGKCTRLKQKAPICPSILPSNHPSNAVIPIWECGTVPSRPEVMR